MRDTLYSSFVEVQHKIKKNYYLSFNKQYSARKGIRIYLEYHSVCPSSETELGLPSTTRNGAPSPQKQGGQHSPAGEGVGGPNLDDWRESQAFCLLCDFCLL
jgi:hypothetical protein